MASQEVLIALETLHREIEKLEPAIKHVETAQQVTQMIKSIPQKHLDLLKDVKSNDAKHKEELKTLFTNEISNLTDESIKIQETTLLIQKAAQAQQKQIDKLVKEISESYARLNDTNIPEKLSEISEFVIANNGFLDKLHKELPGDFQQISKDMKSMHAANISSLQKILEFQRDGFEHTMNKMEDLKKEYQKYLALESKKQRNLLLILFGLIVLIVFAMLLVKQ